MSLNKQPKEILRLKESEVIVQQGNCTVRSFKICIFHQILLPWPSRWGRDLSGM